MEPGTAARARESLQPQMILFVPMFIAEAMTMPVIVPHCTRVFRRPLHLHDRHADLSLWQSQITRAASDYRETDCYASSEGKWGRVQLVIQITVAEPFHLCK